jgi:hypothetical protein
MDFYELFMENTKILSIAFAIFLEKNWQNILIVNNHTSAILE